MINEIFCSAIIPTVGRSTLSRAVESVLQQTLSAADFEILVINDSNRPLAWEDWQRSERVQIIETNHRERSVARNTGATFARGRYLHFLDDDDWLAPGAYQHFWELSQTSSAKWLYGVTQLIDRKNRPTIQLKHGMRGNCFLQALAGEWIPLQSSLIEKKAFLHAGGFNPLLAGPEDIDFLRRFLLEEELGETQNLVAYVIRGEMGSTTDYGGHSTASRWARERALDAPQAFTRMRGSAISPFWWGRVLRVYLTSFVWNLQQRQLFRAGSRAVYALASVFSAGKNCLSKNYWQSASRSYASVTFSRGIQEAGMGK